MDYDCTHINDIECGINIFCVNLVCGLRVELSENPEINFFLKRKWIAVDAFIFIFHENRPRIEFNCLH